MVVVGSFNPTIFQPLWFSNHNLIRKEEAEAAKIEFILNEISSFTTEWFTVQVTVDKFTVVTTDATKYSPLRDLLLGTFSILLHTPVSAMGLNSDQHYRMPSEEEWHAFGHYYAPKESWNKILDNTGMKTVGVEGHRPDSLSNIVNIKIQPSKAVAPGVYFSINQHYDLATDVSPPVSVETSTFAKILGEDWTDFLGYREKVATTLLSDAKTETK